MICVVPGTHYKVEKTDGTTQDIIFCHKGTDGVFINGVTSEEFLAVLQHRFGVFEEKDQSEHNIRIGVYLKQAQLCMKQRQSKKPVHKVVE